MFSPFNKKMPETFASEKELSYLKEHKMLKEFLLLILEDYKNGFDVIVTNENGEKVILNNRYSSPEKLQSFILKAEKNLKNKHNINF